MGQTLAERIEWEAANDPNRMVSAYAGDLRELMVELTARAERAEAALAAMIEQKEDFRICWEEAEAELANLKDELDRSAETLSPGPNLPGTN